MRRILSAILSAALLFLFATQSMAATAPNTELTYAISQLYSYNSADCTYHRILSSSKNKNIFKELKKELQSYKIVKDVKPEEKTEKTLGFLAKLSNGNSLSFYLTENQLYTSLGVYSATPAQCKSLFAKAEEFNKTEGIPQWLVYINPKRITYVDYSDDAGTKFESATAGGNKDISRLLNSLSVKAGSTSFLSTDIIVENEMKLILNFDSGVVYTIYIFKDKLTVASGDMNYALQYTLSDAAKAANLKTAAGEMYCKLNDKPLPANVTPANPDTGKPVICLYPEKPTDCTVKLGYDSFTYTYPAYNDGWQITAYPDGRLKDKTGKEYYYLFWEGNKQIDWRFESGFSVAGKDTERFLEEKLTYMGLNPRERGDFISYWVPRLKDAPYNLITFAGEQYEQLAPLTVTPAPDSILRVHMVYKPIDVPANLIEQKLKPFTRKGFTVVEWGGTRAR
ncbi:MAG: hypothetical protein RR115_05960 [Hydrogenoanaerobacterium sp.]